MLDVVNDIAWRQHGAFSTAQATAAGVSAAWLSRKTADGTIIRAGRGLYRLTCADPTADQRLMLHVLGAGPGAVATGDSGLGLWCTELPRPSTPVVAARVNSGYSGRRVRLIRSSDLDLANPTTIDGIPVASIARSLLDASIGRQPSAVVGLINACQREYSLAFGALVDVLHSHARKGRPGIVTFRGALGRLTETIPDSEFERLVLDDLERWGIDTPELHHVVRIRGEKPIELDLAWHDPLLDVELDGRTHFQIMSDAQRDRQRDRLLQLEGYNTIRFTWRDYLNDRETMMRQISTFVERGRGRRSVV